MPIFAQNELILNVSFGGSEHCMKPDTGLYTIDDVWELQRRAPGHIKHVELINGRPVEIEPAFLLQSLLASKLLGTIAKFAEERDLGTAGIRGGFYSEEDRHNLLAPLIAFISKGRVPDPPPNGFLHFMPDLAVEIAASNNPVSLLRMKTEILLRYGAKTVWIVLPDQRAVEVHRLGKDAQSANETVGFDGTLTGGDVLPGFELKLRQFYSR